MTPWEAGWRPAPWRPAWGDYPAIDPIAALIAQYGGVYLRVWELGDMWQDRAATIPAAIDQPVGAIRNRGSGGSAYMLADDDSGARPVLRQDPETGGLYLQSDGVDDAMTMAQSGAFLAGQWSCGAVARTDTTASGVAYLLDGGTQQARPLNRLADTIRAAAGVRNGTSTTSITVGLSFSANADGALFSTAAGNSVSLYIDETLNSQSGPAGYSLRSGAWPLALFKNASANASYWRGRFYGGYVLPTTLSTTQRDELQTFLLTRAKLV